MTLEAPMQVAFNSDLFLRRPMTGIANYCFEIIRAQQQLDAGIRYLGFTGVGWKTIDAKYLARVADDHQKNGSSADGRSTGPDPIRRLARTGIEVLARNSSRFHIARVLYRSARRNLFSQTLANVKVGLDLFHAFNFQPHAEIDVPTLPVVYDLSFIRFPEAHPKERLRSLETLPKTIARAPLVQTISQFSKDEIVSVFGYPEDRIFVAPPAAAAIFRMLGDGVTCNDLLAFDLRTSSYFLAVGTLEPRKNIKTLITAFQQLSAADRAGCPLIVVGGKGWGHLELPAGTDRLIQAGTLRFVGSVSDPVLRSLYEGARMLLFPSIYEGFGMPVVEALACGTAVAHSAGTSMDEISDELAVRVTATDVDAWTNVMREAISTSGVAGLDLRQARRRQAERFDWHRSAATVLDGYRKIGAARAT
jgi:glycosyltransferase involved in cell wall biosynthesis